MGSLGAGGGTGTGRHTNITSTRDGNAAGGGGGGEDDGKVNVTRHGSIRLKTLRHGSATKNGHTECRSVSPSGSEEEIMTYNGIMRTTDVQVRFEHGDGTLEVGGKDLDGESSRASSDLRGRGDDKGGLHGHV
jgi:hypothetical protein